LETRECEWTEKYDSVKKPVDESEIVDGVEARDDEIEDKARRAANDTGRHDEDRVAVERGGREAPALRQKLLHTPSNLLQYRAPGAVISRGEGCTKDKARGAPRPIHPD